MAERNPSSEGWAEYRRLVLAALERYEEQIETLRSTAGALDNRLTQTERLNAALRNAVFGSQDASSLQTRIALLEKFMKEHPSLTHQGEDGETRTDKKMLFLLVGAISGLIALLEKAFDVITTALGK